MYQVLPATPAQFGEWRAWLAEHTGPSAFLEPAWLDVLEGAYPCKAALLVARDGAERIQGGTLVYHHAAHHRTLYSTPFGVSARDETAMKALLAAIEDHARANAITACDLVPGFDDAHIASMRSWTRPAFMLDLQSDQEAFWSALPSKARNTARKAQNQDLAIEIGAGNLDAWYKIYANQCLYKRLTIHAKRYFELLFEHFPDKAVLITGARNGEVISGMVFLQGCNFAHYLFNASRPEALPTGVNTLLMLEFADHARKLGIRRIDLGESRPGSGVYDFKKKQMGGEEVAMHHYDILDGAPAARASLEERLHYAARFVWPLLPDTARRHNLRQLKTLHRLI